jgi:hypothetical protein
VIEEWLTMYQFGFELGSGYCYPDDFFLDSISINLFLEFFSQDSNLSNEDFKRQSDLFIDNQVVLTCKRRRDAINKEIQLLTKIEFKF